MTTLAKNRGEIGVGFDIAHDRRLAPEAFTGGETFDLAEVENAIAGHAAFSFDGFEQCALLAHDISARTDENLEFKRLPTAQKIVAQKPVLRDRLALRI